ncbi:MAG: tetratricopeptide repeat protein, partial [bacterium]
AFREQQKGNLWTALRHALTAVNELKMSVLCDSTLYDAYMGIGSYHYFINHLWSYIPLLGRDPGKGIEEIRLAVERATFVKVPAQNGLIHILLREERFDEALRLAEDLVLRYPRSRTFHWTLAEVYEDMEDWENAAGTYHKLLSMIEEGQPDNYYNMAYCGERLSYCWYMSGRYNESLLVCVRMFGLLENASDGQRTERLKEALKVLLNKIRKAKLEQ